jgi:hypothetical protein
VVLEEERARGREAPRETVRDELAEPRALPDRSHILPSGAHILPFGAQILPSGAQRMPFRAEVLPFDVRGGGRTAACTLEPPALAGSAPEVRRDQTRSADDSMAAPSSFSSRISCAARSSASSE